MPYSKSNQRATRFLGQYLGIWHYVILWPPSFQNGIITHGTSISPWLSAWFVAKFSRFHLMIMVEMICDASNSVRWPQYKASCKRIGTKRQNRDHFCKTGVHTCYFIFSWEKAKVECRVNYRRAEGTRISNVDMLHQSGIQSVEKQMDLQQDLCTEHQSQSVLVFRLTVSCISERHCYC